MRFRRKKKSKKKEKEIKADDKGIIVLFLHCSFSIYNC